MSFSSSSFCKKDILKGTLILEGGVENGRYKLPILSHVQKNGIHLANYFHAPIRLNSVVTSASKTIIDDVLLHEILS